MSRESPWCHYPENPLVQVVTQGSLFSQILFIYLFIFSIGNICTCNTEEILHVLLIQLDKPYIA